MNYPKATYNPESQLAKTAREIVERQNAERKAAMDAKIAAIDKAQEATRKRIADEKAAHEKAVAEVAEKRAQARLDSVKESARRAWRGSAEKFDAWWNNGGEEATLAAVAIEEMHREREQIAAQGKMAMNIFNGRG